MGKDGCRTSSKMTFRSTYSCSKRVIISACDYYEVYKSRIDEVEIMKNEHKGEDISFIDTEDHTVVEITKSNNDHGEST